MLDPITALAFAMFSGKGVYALLLGSGISRAAEIPTGWEVTLDLIKKVAAASGETCDESPEAWYRKKFDREPDYSDLLALVAKEPAERTNALAGYFEARAEDNERGAKKPTAAHLAIAKLVAKGYVRVIITINFDRLLEQALAVEGIAASIISTDDMVRGALPLVHAPCTVIKVHGDYRDTRFRNTVEELSAYSEEMNGLLDRVVDEYGMVVAGWSASWDAALRSVFLRAANRRFTMTWAAKGPLSEEAMQVVCSRGASVVEIESADSFFSSVLSKVEALETYNAPHPMSVQLAVASVKRLMADSGHRIELHELFMTEADQTLKNLQGSAQIAKNVVSQAQEYMEAVAACEVIAETVTGMAATLAYFANEDHDNVLGVTILRLYDGMRERKNHTNLKDVKGYPACLAFYAAGVAACAANRYAVLVPLFRTTQLLAEINDSEKKILPAVLFVSRLLRKEVLNAENKLQLHVPASERIFGAIRPFLRQLIPEDEAYAEAFDRFEYLLAVRFFEARLAKTPAFGGVWAAPGRFLYRNREFGKHVSEVLKEEASEQAPSSGFIGQGLFRNPQTFIDTSDQLMSEFVSKFNAW